MNAPKIPKAGIPSNPQITLRLSVEAKAEAIAAAERDGVKSLGTWIKRLMRQRIEHQSSL